MQEVKIRMSAKAFDELYGCEYASFEDNIINYGSRSDEYINKKHICELIEERKSKGVLTLNSQQDVDTFFEGMASGLFGIYMLGTAQRLYDQLAPLANPVIVKRWPKSMLGF